MVASRFIEIKSVTDVYGTKQQQQQQQQQSAGAAGLAPPAGGAPAAPVCHLGEDQVCDQRRLMHRPVDLVNMRMAGRMPATVEEANKRPLQPQSLEQLLCGESTHKCMVD